MQHELDKMSPDDMRNRLIVEMTAHSTQTDYQSFNDFDLAGMGAVMVFLRGARIRTDAELKTMSADDQRNVAIVEIGSQTNLGSKLQGLRVDPVFEMPPPPRTAPPVASGDTATFDVGPLTSGLPLGGAVHLVTRRNGDFTFSSHAHDSGFDNIDYVVSAVLVTASGIAFTFQRAGHVEGTSAGLPFGAPNRNDDFTTIGENPMITREFDGIFVGAKLRASLDGKDKLVGGVAGMPGDLRRGQEDVELAHLRRLAVEHHLPDEFESAAFHRHLGQAVGVLVTTRLRCNRIGLKCGHSGPKIELNTVSSPLAATMRRLCSSWT